MPRMPTGKPPGRPRIEVRSDGEPDPVSYRPSPEARQAIGVEVFFFRILEMRRSDEAPWPVLASATQVARQAGATTRAVQKWRKKRWYHIHFWSAVLSDKLMDADLQAQAAKAISVHRKDLVVWAREGWPKEGFVDSMVNGRRFHSPEKYAQHLRQEGAIPTEWLTQEMPALST